ncbi:hypothetical protein V8E51_014541 [Hyaloscypha variabilis]
MSHRRRGYSLETALLRVKRLEVDPAQNSELVSLQQAAVQCQRTIDNFWKQVQKYQPHLRAGGSSSKLKDGWMKIKWAVCKKEDVARFKADLVGHTESIQLLLTAMQMALVTLHEKRHDKHAQSLAGKVQDSYFGCMQRLSSIAESLQSGIEQGKKLLEMTTKVMQTNIQVFQVVLDIQNIIKRIPGQIDRQQPVYFIDALGKSSPFHLEFVRSAEALVSVLKVNFKKVGHAPEMIERGDFVIQDSATKKDVNLEMDWELCFSPGQRVEMSMVFKRPARPTNTCPTCKADCGGSTEEDIECPKCGLNFRRVLDLGNVPDSISNVNRLNAALRSVKSPVMYDPIQLDPILPTNSLKRKRGENQEEIDEVSLFRRVRIYNIVHGLVLPNPPRSELNYRVQVNEQKLNGLFALGSGIVDIRPKLKVEQLTFLAGRQIVILSVKSEDQPDRLLLEMQPAPEHNFQTQRYNNIIWTDDNGIDLGLSFWDPDGFAEIWRYLNDIISQMTSEM